MEHKNYIEQLIKDVLQQSGSDLHISTNRLPMMRISGNLIPMLKHEKPQEEDMSKILEIILPEHKKQLIKERAEIDFSYNFQNKVRLRGNVFLHKGMYSVALRFVPEVKAISELNLPPILEDFSRRRQGFFLVVGPVGQGKSTTLASMIDLINKERAEHIITIENPVEFNFIEDKSVIDQREVGVDTQSFEDALVSSLRQDVNVIMIGEMRNTKTISAAVTAAETGHLVFSTLHTNNAAQTIDRIIDSFPPGQQDQIRVQLAGSLLGIFSQRLLPRISGGRIPAYELLVNNYAVANLIREKRTHEIDVVIETGSEHGMIDMNRSLIQLVQQGEVTVDDARQYSFNPKAFDRMIG